MAAEGTRIFLLGGLLSADAEANDPKLIYVLDTSMYYLFLSSDRLQDSKHRANHVPGSRPERCRP